MARDSQLTALLMSPNRELAQNFAHAQSSYCTFQVLADIKGYLTGQSLELRLRQLRPNVVLLDLSTDLDQAVEVIQEITASQSVIHVIGIHTSNDSNVLVRSFRAGATEFLYSPFEQSTQLEAVSRIKRLIEPDTYSEQEFAFVLGFTSTKPGSGASTLAAQTAFALQRLNNKVLLLDLDLMGGAIGFYLKIQNTMSVLDLLESTEPVDSSLWSNLKVNVSGVDVVTAPDDPSTKTIDQSRLHDLLEYAKRRYDWVIVDMPSIFQKTSLLSVPETDLSLLVSTSELPSLHLTRKAIGMLTQLGFEKHRYQVVVNRGGKRDGLAGSDLEKMFGCPVFSSLPNDYFSLNRVVTLGEPLEALTDLGKSIDAMVTKLRGIRQAERKKAQASTAMRPALSNA